MRPVNRHIGRGSGCRPGLRLALAGLLAAVFGVAPAVAADLMVPDGSPRDELLPEPRVSADAVIVGLVQRRDGPATARSVLAAIPSADRAGKVCLRVKTGDGLYSGEAVYSEASPGGAAFALLPYATDRAAFYDYPQEQVALLVHPCADRDLGRIAVASWAADEAASPAETADLLVNSFRADAAFVAMPDGEIRDCEGIVAGTRAAFDFRCPLPVASLGVGGRLELYRVRSGSLDAPIAFDVIAWE